SLPPWSSLFPYTTLFRSPARVGGRPGWPGVGGSRVAGVPGGRGGTGRAFVAAGGAAAVAGRDAAGGGDGAVAGNARRRPAAQPRSEEHTSELQSRENLVC